MNQVQKSPVDTGDWLTMLMLKKSVEYMKENNVDNKYKNAIKKEGNILKTFMSKATIKEAA